MIQILSYTPQQRGACIGYVDIKLEINKIGFIIRRISHLRKGEREWFNFPQFSEDAPNFDGNGQNKRYVRYCEYLSPDHNNALLSALREAVKAYFDKQAKPEPLIAEMFKEEEVNQPPPVPEWEKGMF